MTPSFRCGCLHPRPLSHNGEDWGLCATCTFVYDENLYEMRLRQHVPGFDYEDVASYLFDNSEDYRAASLRDALSSHPSNDS